MDLQLRNAYHVWILKREYYKIQVAYVILITMIMANQNVYVLILVKLFKNAVIDAKLV